MDCDHSLCFSHAGAGKGDDFLVGFEALNARAAALILVVERCGCSAHLSEANRVRGAVRWAELVHDASEQSAEDDVTRI